MSRDARFEDAGEAPLNLLARDAEDLQVISALVQDAVLPGSEMAYRRKERRFALLVNRVRWEDGAPDPAAERVRALLVFENVLSARVQGIGADRGDAVFSLLALSFAPSGVEGDVGGTAEMILAGDGAIALECEALEVSLRDVTRPYVAPSGRRPSHD